VYALLVCYSVWAVYAFGDDLGVVPKNIVLAFTVHLRLGIFVEILSTELSSETMFV